MNMNENDNYQKFVDDKAKEMGQEIYQSIVDNTIKSNINSQIEKMPWNAIERFLTNLYIKLRYSGHDEPEKDLCLSDGSIEPVILKRELWNESLEKERKAKEDFEIFCLCKYLGIESMDGITYEGLCSTVFRDAEISGYAEKREKILRRKLVKQDFSMVMKRCSLSDNL